MMDIHAAEVIKDLASKDVGFYASHDIPGGQATVHLTAQQVLEYAADPVSYLAAHYGVSRGDYLEWHQSGYRVVCCGFTKAGKPCKATVPGLSIVGDPKTWVQGQGGRCTAHG
jgi:hypothetical protein